LLKRYKGVVGYLERNEICVEDYKVWSMSSIQNK